MKSVDWTPGFSSRSLKGWLKAGIPGNSDVTGAVKSAYSTGYTSSDDDSDGGLAPKRKRRMFSPRRNSGL